MKRHSIQGKLGVMITLLIIVSLSLTGLIINRLVGQELRQNVITSNTALTKVLSDRIQSFFQNTGDTFSYLASSDSIKSGEEKNLTDAFREVMAQYSQFHLLYLGTTDGRLIAYPTVNLPAGFDPRTRPWYKQALASNTMTWTDVYIDVVTNKPVVTVSLPITNAKGQIIGVLGGDIGLDSLSILIAQTTIGKTGYAFLTDNKGIIISHPQASLIGKKASSLGQESLVNQVLRGKSGFAEIKAGGSDNLVCYGPVQAIRGGVFTQLSSQEAFDVIHKVRKSLALVIFLTLLLANALAYLIIKKYITTPINQLVQGTERMAQGDLTAKVADQSKDELGQLARAFNQMNSKLSQILEQISRASQKVNGSTQELNTAAEEVSHRLEKVSHAIDQVAQGADQQSSSVNNSVSLVKNMSQDISQIAAGGQIVAEASENTYLAAKKGQEILNRVTEQMQIIKTSGQSSVEVIGKLDRTSQEIGQILEMISGIANQTNLLALNAAIEAARAGEHGRGFAVVAEEVKKLAEGSLQAGEQIAQLIKESQAVTTEAMEVMLKSNEQVAKGEEVVLQAGSSFEKIMSALGATQKGIESSRLAATQLETSSQQVVETIENIAEVATRTTASAQQVSAATQEQASSLEEISNTTKDLMLMVEELENLVKQFNI